MTVYDISQYAPHALALLCLVGALGLPGPTVQNPNTWHMTLFIVFALSLFNILMAPIYDFFMSTDRLAEVGDTAWRVGFAYIYGFFGFLDYVTFKLVWRFSQKGRAAIARLMAGFILVNVMAITDIIAYIYLDYSLGAFSSLLIATDAVYSNYTWLIAMLNIAQFAVLFGGLDGWSRSNITRNVLSIGGTSPNTGDVRARIASLCYRGSGKGVEANGS